MKKKKILCVMPECYIDTNLIEYLLNSGVNHQHCCSKVVDQLNTTFKNSFAIGIIDKDKVQLGYIKECWTVANSKHLTLLKHKQKPQYLITVSPAIDGFIIDSAKQQEVDMKNYDIPSDLKDFIKLSKTVNSNSDKRFKKLFEAIKNNPEVSILKSVLKYLTENKFSAKEEDLEEIFNS